MAPDRTAQRAAAAAERRPAVSPPARQPNATTGESAARALQRRFGNHGTQSIVARSIANAAREAPAEGASPVSASVPNSIQLSRTTRLPAKVSKPTDPAELEAEDTARKVMRMREATAPAPATKKAGAGDKVQREAASTPPVSAPAAPARVVNTSGGSPLPAPVRGQMERRFGASFGNVRVHTGDAAAQHSGALNANAFTVGQDVFFGKDKFQPQSAGGQELIAHELTHTIQQGAAVQHDAVHRSAAVTVTEQVAPQVQRSIFDIADPRT